MTKSRNWLIGGRPDAIRLNPYLNQAFCLYVDAMVPLIETLLDKGLEGDDWRAEIENGVREIIGEISPEIKSLIPENTEWGPCEIVRALALYWEDVFGDVFPHTVRPSCNKVFKSFMAYGPHGAHPDPLSTLEDIYQALRRVSRTHKSIRPKADMVLALIENLKQERIGE